jgi:hypothetical protein
MHTGVSPLLVSVCYQEAKAVRPIWKIMKQEKGWAMVEGAVHLLSKYKPQFKTYCCKEKEKESKEEMSYLA